MSSVPTQLHGRSNPMCLIFASTEWSFALETLLSTSFYRSVYTSVLHLPLNRLLRISSIEVCSIERMTIIFLIQPHINTYDCNAVWCWLHRRWLRYGTEAGRSVEVDILSWGSGRRGGLVTNVWRPSTKPQPEEPTFRLGLVRLHPKLRQLSLNKSYYLLSSENVIYHFNEWKKLLSKGFYHYHYSIIIIIVVFYNCY